MGFRLYENLELLNLLFFFGFFEYYIYMWYKNMYICKIVIYKNKNKEILIKEL